VVGLNRRNTSTVWLPSAAVVLQERGSDYIAAIDDAPWSQGHGFHRGFFSSFRIRAGKNVWFHFPLPTPTEANGVQRALDAVMLMWEVMDAAQINWIVLQHGGMERIPLTEIGNEPPFESVPFDPPELWREYYPKAARRLTRIAMEQPLPLRFGLQLSVGIQAADGDGTVRFYGAGAAFSDYS